MIENRSVALGSDWHCVSTSLTYRLGEMKLFSVDFEGLAYRKHFSKLEPSHQLPVPPPAADKHSFVFYPCYPIAFDPKPLARVGQWITYTPYVFRNYYVDIKRIGTFDAYLKQFSSKSRSTLQRKVRQFAAASGGKIRWEIYRTAADMDWFFKLAGAVSAKTYQERLLGNGLPTDSSFKARAAELASTGRASGFILFLAEKPVAYVFAFCNDRIMTYNYVGYDPDAASHSPGTVLQYLILERLFSEAGVDIFDFTEGEGQQKALFATDDRLCGKTYFLKYNVRHTLLACSHYALIVSVQATGSALEQLRLKSALRRLIRRAA